MQSFLLPWQHPDLKKWAIVGMNHYFFSGSRKLFVAMTNEKRQCISSEGPDLPELWEDLRKQARIINGDN